MANFTSVFNAAIPVDTDLVKDTDTFITDFKTQVKERTALEHYDFATGNINQAATDACGRHKPGYTQVVFVGDTAAIAALSGMTLGCLAYNTTLGQLQIYGGSSWSTYTVGSVSTAFKVVRSATAITAATPQKLTFTSEEFDYSSAIVPATGTYVVPVTGVYHFQYSAMASSTINKAQLHLTKNTVTITGSYAMAYTLESTNTTMVNGSVLVACTAGESIELYWLYETGSSKSVSATFSGYKVG